MSKAHKIWGEQVQGLVGRPAQDELHTDEHAQDLPKDLVQPLAHIMTSWQTKSGTRQVHAGWYAGRACWYWRWWERCSTAAVPSVPGAARSRWTGHAAARWPRAG
ncbi:MULTISPECIES: hypothetical protein [Streptomyces]|uniref:hypothetical protein n=1 Tax=Streptomyces TaxID=1883 RepID=UPI0016005D18|nr:hypothetical protein [Streptomyces murinus]MBA9047557.1 hypothetical protein [Streptomyces murinus]